MSDWLIMINNNRTQANKQPENNIIEEVMSFNLWEKNQERRKISKKSSLKLPCKIVFVISVFLFTKIIF